MYICCISNYFLVIYIYTHIYSRVSIGWEYFLAGWLISVSNLFSFFQKDVRQVYKYVELALVLDQAMVRCCLKINLLEFLAL